MCPWSPLRTGPDYGVTTRGGTPVVPALCHNGAQRGTFVGHLNICCLADLWAVAFTLTLVGEYAIKSLQVRPLCYPRFRDTTAVKLQGHHMGATPTH
jgi:hypothetical protein